MSSELLGKKKFYNQFIVLENNFKMEASNSSTDLQMIIESISSQAAEIAQIRLEEELNHETEYVPISSDEESDEEMETVQSDEKTMKIMETRKSGNQERPKTSNLK